MNRITKKEKGYDQRPQTPRVPERKNQKGPHVAPKAPDNPYTKKTYQDALDDGKAKGD